jgi:hypothetical protein
MAVNRILNAGPVDPDALVQIIVELLHLINGESEEVHEVTVVHYYWKDALRIKVEDIINGWGGFTVYRLENNQLVKDYEIAEMPL